MDSHVKINKSQKKALERLNRDLNGDLRWDIATRLQYATDASAYREVPLAVATPKNRDDLSRLIRFAKANGVGLIPRAAGTSLAGQVVGNGIVVDVSKHWTRIVDIDRAQQRVTVEPGVILDHLNMALKPLGLLFGPETSTASRCMIAGMVGNNSCGAHSLIYGSTREHLLALKMMLDDGNEYTFGEITRQEFQQKCSLNTREGQLYRFFDKLLGNGDTCQEVIAQSPDPQVKRRNNGYALDTLISTSFFGSSAQTFNLCKLIAGSEGTLGIITQITLNLVPLPPPQKAVVAVHLKERNQAFQANLIALKHRPAAVEMMDQVILRCTMDNLAQQRNRDFVIGEPGAILIVEFYRETREQIEQAAANLERDLRQAHLGYHFPIIWNEQTQKVWALRKAGLGVLSNVEGDAKPVSLVEDTAVTPSQLPSYMHDFEQIMDKYHLDCVYHAHIGTGELHLRPVLNLKDAHDVELFRTLAGEVARLVKKYRGSLSGEHGDGRLRGEFLPIMLGPKVYAIMQEVKKAFDPYNIFNPNKIVDTPPMNTCLRYRCDVPVPQINTVFNFNKTQGIVRAVEKCNGSADCRKTKLSGGTLCPSYMATLDEANSTRARANVLREFLSRSGKRNPFNHREIYKSMDQCLSCKACKSECPASVDMAKLKAEFLQHWYDVHGIPMRTRAIAYITHIYRLGSCCPRLTNFVLTNRLTARLLKGVLGFAPNRQMPLLGSTTLRRWFKRQKKNTQQFPNGTVYLLPDEFSNFTDVNIGIAAVELLNGLGYKVLLADVFESGRTYISKGLLRTARRIANRNILMLKDLVTERTPLIGIEPSAILTFRDEYPDLASPENIEPARLLAKNALMFDEFFVRETQRGHIVKSQFRQAKVQLKLHGHCQQKAVATTDATKAMLSFPDGYTVSEIPSGCCGMAGSFGHEKEHYKLSMAVGELVLFPEIRKTPENVIIVAPGTSCRQQILDGTGREALHPIQVMRRALK